MTPRDSVPVRLTASAIWIGDYGIWAPDRLGGGSAQWVDGDQPAARLGLYRPDGSFRPLRTRPALGFPR